jgi:putative zinc finger/helix-turn-helix YgiT family protein
MAAGQKEQRERTCPSCGRGALVPRVIRDEFEYGPEDERITIVAEGVPVLECPACGETLYGPDAARVRHQAICLTLGLLTPEQIKGVREKLGKKQAEFAELTGIGVATLSRWEQGRLIQTRALDRYLRVLENTPAAVRVLERLRGQETEAMMLEAIVNPDEIAQAFAQLRQRLCSPDTFRRRIGFRGGAITGDVCWQETGAYWVYTSDTHAPNRLLCLFGAQRPTAHQSLNITVEINPPKEGTDRRCQGLFARDQAGRIYLIHFGKVGGGKKGIGRDTFAAFYDDAEWATICWPDGSCKEGIVIGELDAPDFRERLSTFIHKVAAFKSAGN